MITTTECGDEEVEVYDADGDEPDSAVAADNVHLRQLCTRLRKDLKQLLIFTIADCQVN